MHYFSTLRPCKGCRIDEAKIGLEAFSEHCASVVANLHKFHSGIQDPHIHCTFTSHLQQGEARELLTQSLSPYWKVDYLAPARSWKASVYYASGNRAIPIFFK